MSETIKMKCIETFSTHKQFKVHVQFQCNHPICNHTNKNKDKPPIKMNQKLPSISLKAKASI